MKFCPKCENLLYQKKKGLYCKFCGSYFNKEEVKSKIELAYVNINKNKQSSNDLIEEKEIKKLHILNLLSHINYLQFFPYKEFRENQEAIIKKIEKAAKSKENILLVAPNGTGKTIIALSGLLPVALKNNLKILYLCRTHSQNTRVIKELIKISNFLQKNNLTDIKINGLSIRGRNEMCLNETLLSLKLNPKESMAVCTDLRKNRNCSHFLNLLKKRDGLDKPILIAPEM
ncbi:MAG: hypothetical protein EU532_13805, partial [Promethearchaeota archaeon]